MTLWEPSSCSWRIKLVKLHSMVLLTRFSRQSSMLRSRTKVLISNTELSDWQFGQQINPGSSRLDHELGHPVLNLAFQPDALSSQVTIWTDSTTIFNL